MVELHHFERNRCKNGGGNKVLMIFTVNGVGGGGSTGGGGAVGPVGGGSWQKPVTCSESGGGMQMDGTVFEFLRLCYANLYLFSPRTILPREPHLSPN